MKIVKADIHKKLSELASIQTEEIKKSLLASILGEAKKAEEDCGCEDETDCECEDDTDVVNDTDEPRDDDLEEASDSVIQKKIATLKAVASKLNSLSEKDPAYKAVTSVLDAMSKEQLKTVARADIKFVSALAQERISEHVEEIDLFLNEETNEHYYIELDEETLEERKIIVRINSRGQRIKKITCPKGRVVKTVNGRKVCVTPPGREKLTRKLAIRKSTRTKKAKGAGYKKRVNFKRQRALKKRKQMGVPKQDRYK